MSKNKSNKKDYFLTPGEGKALCAEAKASVEYGMSRFPEVDEDNERFENSRFHQWVKERNSKKP